jgi:hypothetical protein
MKVRAAFILGMILIVFVAIFFIRHAWIILPLSPILALLAVVLVALWVFSRIFKEKK